MKRSEKIFALLQIPFDAVFIALAFVAAYYTRIQGEVIYVWDFGAYFKFVLNITPLWLLIFAISGLYRFDSIKKRGVEEFRTIFLASSSAIMFVVAYIFLSKTEFFSRLIVVYAWGYSILFVTLYRLALKAFRIWLLKYDIGVYRLLVVGERGVAKRLINSINSTPKLGYKIVKIVDKAGLQKIQKILSKYAIDEILLADPTVSDREVSSLMETTYGRQIIIKYIPSIYRLRESNFQIDTVADIPIFTVKKTPLEGWGAIVKRVMDLFIAAAALILFSPVLAIIALAIKFTSKGPVIYKNLRVGIKGNFYAYKFRTMKLEFCTGAEYGGEKALKFENKLIREKNIKKGSAVYKIADDPRITPVGKFLRKTSLDELPQFWNVLLGSMSVVGPRPHQPREVKNYTPAQRKLLDIQPGITGLSQISGRSDLTFEEEARLEIYYIENWSLWGDVKIILGTFKALFMKSGAY